MALEQGAGAVIDSRDVAGLADHVRTLTDGRGADVVVDGVGRPLFEPSLRALAVGGRHVVAGSASQQPAMLDARRLLPRNQTLCGFILAHISEQDPGEPSRSLLRLCGLIRDGALVPRFETAPLEQAPGIHRRIEDRTLVWEGGARAVNGACAGPTHKVTRGDRHVQHEREGRDRDRRRVWDRVLRRSRCSPRAGPRL